MSLDSIIKNIGISIQSYERVSGGDINDAYCLHENSKKYFLKVNSASEFPKMFAKEAKGLRELQITDSKLQIPEVLKHGIADDQQ